MKQRPLSIMSGAHGDNAVLRHNLQTLRNAIDDYRADHGEDPRTIETLVDEKYLRSLPFE